MKLFISSALLLISFCSSAQSDTSLFSFWVGQWNARWTEISGKDTVIATGENNITRDLGGKVLHEHFRVFSGQSKGFVGESWSVLSKATGNWQQTWVDNQGAYMTFTRGKGPSGEPTFEQHFSKNGKEIWQRMVFKDIKADSFTWDWEASADGGKTYNLNWRIYYERKK